MGPEGHAEKPQTCECGAGEGEPHAYPARSNTGQKPQANTHTSFTKHVGEYRHH